MAAFWLCVGVALLAFGFGVLGLHLKKLLPEEHATNSRDMIGAIVGLVSLLVALVLGTLIGSAYAFYSTQKSEIETMAARSIQLDLALSEYGAETMVARQAMKTTLQGVRDAIWGSNSANVDLTVAAPLPHLKLMDEYLASLDPKTPAQTRFAAAATADAGVIEQTRILVALQLASPVSWPLVVIVVSWALILFCGFGFLSRITPTTIGAMALGAFAVGSALFLILELSRPFSGLFRVPSGAFDQMLAVLAT
jgi:Protein of unknown function (DUF4239)